jgi:perosamine synthetase
MVNPTLYCGGPFVRLRGWLCSPHQPVKLSNCAQFRDCHVIGTFRGRTAISLACDLLGIGPGHEVLVPAYNCGTELDALQHSGAQVVGYRISQNCQIDLDDLKSRKTNRTRAVYLIHYFGWGQPMAEIRRWCDDHGLFLIEDCALALFSEGAKGSIGRTGDVAIYSLTKTLGTWHGGLLTLPSGARAVPIPGLSPAGKGVLMEEIWHSVKPAVFRGLDLFGLYGALHSMRSTFRDNSKTSDDQIEYPGMPGNYYFNPDVDGDRAVHPQLWGLFNSLSCEEIVRRRRDNYLRLADALSRISSTKPLYKLLPAGVCPLSFPLLVANRDKCIKAFQARGIAAYPWWAGFHRSAIDWSQFPEACYLKRHVLTLPIHHALDDWHMEHVAETAVEFFIRSKMKWGAP